jgi:hypothetical protein
MLEILEEALRPAGCEISVKANHLMCSISVTKDSIELYEITSYNVPHEFPNKKDIQTLIDETAMTVLAEMTGKGIQSISLN